MTVDEYQTVLDGDAGSCPAADVNGDLIIDITELVRTAAALSRTCPLPPDPVAPPIPGDPSVVLNLGPAVGAPGVIVSFPVVLTSDVGTVRSLQNYIGFGAAVAIAAQGGRPRCALNQQLADAGGALMSLFAPAGCTPGIDCTRVMVVINDLPANPPQ